MALDQDTRNKLERRLLDVMDVAERIGYAAVYDAGNALREYLYSPEAESASAYGLVRAFEYEAQAAVDKANNQIALFGTFDGMVGNVHTPRPAYGGGSSTSPPPSSAARAPVPATTAPTTATPIKTAGVRMAGLSWPAWLLLGAAGVGAVLLMRQRKR